MAIEFFGNIDRVHKDDRKQIGSEYPAWFFDNHIDELHEELNSIKARLANDRIPLSEIPAEKKHMRTITERIADIEKSRPVLQGKDKDTLAINHKELGERIRDMMPTHSDMMGGYAKAHDEARLMSTPCISIKDMPLLKNLPLKVVDGKVSRDQASRAYQIMGRLLGENTSVERLRRDRVGGVYRNEMPMHEMER